MRQSAQISLIKRPFRIGESLFKFGKEYTPWQKRITYIHSFSNFSRPSFSSPLNQPLSFPVSSHLAMASFQMSAVYCILVPVSKLGLCNFHTFKQELISRAKEKDDMCIRKKSDPDIAHLQN